jgi:hypothetical protein
VPFAWHGLAPEVHQLLVSYLDKDRKADIDWTDPKRRAAQLKILVQDADAALDLAAAQADDPEVRSAGWMLTKVLGDDVVTDEHGDPQIGHGTASDRIISVTEPEMRHGHKSKAQRFDGFKTAVATEIETELILDMADLPATRGDGEHLMPTVRRVEDHAGVTVERIIGDGAYPSGKNLAACATHEPAPIDLVGPLSRVADPEVAKSAFQLDLEAQQATCPEGHTVRGTRARIHGHPAVQFRFQRAYCAACRLFVRCVQGKVQGRTITTDDYERYRQLARQRQETPEFRELYRKRSRVERKQAELVRHGLRHTRYLGQAKRSLQRLWTAAAVNLKRLFRLAERRGSDLRSLLVGIG